MTRLVALLRGINLGRTNRIPMAELRAMLEDMGHRQVRTHLQSGNVVLSSDDAPDDVASGIEAELRARFGTDVDVVVRTAGELADVVAANPLADVATDAAKYQVVFLSAPPDPEALRAIDPDAVAPERFSARGREVYVWCPDGVRNSAVLKALGDRRVGATATARNWNTVTKLLALAEEAG
jgi:uncharacterized protein (DUF1697 family)